MKNIDYINLAVSKKLNIPIDVVRKTNAFYWHNVKDTLRSMEEDSIYIKEIGTFDVSNFKIKAAIKSVRGYIKNLRKSYKYGETRKETIIRYYKTLYSKLLKAYRKNEEQLNYLKTYRKPKNQENV